MTRHCIKCRSVPGVCALGGDCFCHQKTSEARTARLAREFVDESLAARRRPIPRHTEAAIIAAQVGVDSAVEVARRHRVTVGEVHDIWRAAKRDD